MDSLGGLGVGVLVLSLRHVLASWYGLPVSVITAMGGANLLYGSFSLTLAARPAQRRRVTVLALSLANMVWAIVCGALVWRFGAQLTVMGHTVLVFEALYVGGLGMVECWLRHELLERDVRGAP